MSQALEHGGTCAKSSEDPEGRSGAEPEQLPGFSNTLVLREAKLLSPAGIRGGWVALAQLWSLSGPPLNQT